MVVARVAALESDVAAEAGRDIVLPATSEVVVAVGHADVLLFRLRAGQQATGGFQLRIARRLGSVTLQSYYYSGASKLRIARRLGSVTLGRFPRLGWW